jgi:hypothetical protein
MRRALVCSIVGVAGLVVVLATAVRGTSDHRAPSPTAPTATAPHATAVPAVAPVIAEREPASSTIDDVLAAGAEDSGELVAAIASRDAVIVAEATNALVAGRHVSALPALVAFDVIGRPWAAPSIIDALGRLGAIAAPEDRATVVARLVALLQEEKRRGAVESQGNLLQIYEALGLTGDRRAIEPLERELVDPAVGIAPKVVVVQALVALRATQSRGLLERLYAQLETSAAGIGFEAELRRDLLAVIREALVQLS